MTIRPIAFLASCVFFLAACGTATSTADTADATPADVLSGTDATASTDATADSTSADAYAPPKYVCNQVMGVSVTGEWFAGGFESFVDDGHWQGMTLSHAYVDLWADSTNTVWGTPLVSPCTKNSSDPDRILFTGCNWDYKTAAEWTQALTAVVGNLKGKYPSVKRIDLLTMIRAPGNKLCEGALNNEAIVAPYIDEAMANVAAAFPDLVVVAPKFEAPNCDVFVLGGPHFTPDGAAVLGQIFGAYYNHNQ